MRLLKELPTTDRASGPCEDCSGSGALVEPSPDPTLYGTEHGCPTCHGTGLWPPAA